MTTIYRARSESRNFVFEAFGETEGLARAALASGLEKHVEQYRIDSEWAASMLDGCVISAIASGACYRNGDPLTGVVVD